MKALANWLAEGAEKFGVSVHAWVFMTNHIHLLVTPAHDDSISKFMQYMGRYYVPYFNHRSRRTGTLFEGRFKSHLVESKQYFLECTRYIELNPVRAGMVANPADYVWSSYVAHAFGVDMRLWTPHSEYLALGQSPAERQKSYRLLINEVLDDDVVKKIRYSASTGFVLGNNTFKAEVEQLSGVPQSYQQRGPKPKVREP